MPRQPAEELTCRPPDLAATATAMLAPFVDELPEEELARLLADALDFPIPLVELDSGLYVLELFHGPTLAFKDVGARFMARLMGRLGEPAAEDGGPARTILVATSGDTGSAVAHAFAGQPGLRVAILYPAGKVSRLQERQLTTVGGNVQALAVEGDFDDCQRLVKEAFGDSGLRRDLRLTSANSINVGRLLPQMVYYAHAVSQLPSGAPPPVFSTPSGNFGNLTAGLMAGQRGLDCRGFVAATNVNDSVPRFLAGSDYEPRPAQATLSNAMDVGDPSNFRRMLWLFGGEPQRLREAIRGSRHDDEETARAIVRVHRETGYLLDPHTAVGYLGLTRRLAELDEPHPGIVLATAHPAKFRHEIQEILGFEIELPERLARCLEQESHSLTLAPELPALARFLRSDWGD